MTAAPPPPTDREAQNAVTPAMLKAAWATWKARHGGKLGPGPAFVEAIAAALAAGPLVELADLRSKLAAVEGENERLWQDGETAKTELSRLVVSLQADLAAADSRAREAGARAERAEAALKQVGSQYITHRGDMTDAEALSAIECIVRQTVEWEA